MKSEQRILAPYLANRREEMAEYMMGLKEKYPVIQVHDTLHIPGHRNMADLGTCQG